MQFKLSLRVECGEIIVRVTVDSSACLNMSTVCVASLFMKLPLKRYLEDPGEE